MLYLSHCFRRYRQTYYDLLQSVRDTGDWESRLAFFPRGVAAGSIEAAATARRILDLRPYSAPARETPYRGHRAFRARRRIPAFAEMTSE